jgi:hypothetical protein
MKFQAGDVVRTTGYDFYTGIGPGNEGVCRMIQGFHGKSVYPDPRKMLVFVEWETGDQISVPASLLEKVRLV